MVTKRQKQVLDFITDYQGRKGYAPSLDEIRKKLKLSSVSTAHFHVSKLRDLGYLSKEENKPRSIEAFGRETMVKIPLLGTIAAGQPIEAIQNKEMIAVPKSKIPSSSEVYALRVVGSSMIDENINDGDVVLVRQQETAENGQKVVALIDNHEATLKKFYKERGHIRLQPANKSMEPLIFRNGRDVSIQGIVLDVIRQETPVSITFPEIRTETKRYKELPINKIICGNAIGIMKEFPSTSIDLVITSPPYNLKNSTGNGMKDGRGGKWANAALQKGYSHHNDCMQHDEYVKWQRDCLNEMMRIIPEDGAIFYNHKWRVQGGLLQDRQDIVNGFPVRQIIIWKRKGGLNFNAGYFLPTYEVIYLIAKPKFKLSTKANAHGDVWDFTQEMNNEHPAAFPVNLIDRIVSATDAKIVLDPFMGSGTTAISAINFKRDYIGIDISPEYCEMARKRIKQHQAQSKLW